MDAHWDQFYVQAAAEYGSPWYQPTEFSRHCCDWLPKNSHVIDLGCGNGRDTVHLATKHLVVGIDGSHEAVALARAFAAYSDSLCQFVCVDFSHLASFLPRFDAAYSRFSLHAVSTDVQNALLRQLATGLQFPGLLLVEARSAVTSEAHQETHDGHYRRLLKSSLVQRELKDAGFHVLSCAEVRGARFGDDEPVVIRIAATCTSWRPGEKS